jgi:hypothetical protein
MHTDIEIVNKISTNLTEQLFKKTISHDQFGFTPGIQEWFNIYKSINVIYKIYKDLVQVT